MSHGSSRRRSSLAALGLITLIAPRLEGQQLDRNSVMPLPRLTGPIVVDGRSDDAAWQNVPTLPLTVYLPAYGTPSTERTDARVAYDDNAMYVMVDAWETHPGNVRASSMVRDDDAPGDFLNFLLDTFGDRQTALNFSTTPGGQRNDWSISNDARTTANFSPAWNGVWDLAVRRDRDGWHAEYRIPFSTLRFNARGDVIEFGLSLNRLTAHSNERVTFPAIEPNEGTALWKPSRWQRVSVSNINPGHYVRLTPYVLGGSEGRHAPDPVSPWSRDDKFEAGGDLKVGVTKSLTLDLTANTDFAEAEVDDQRVNFTRFPLFYPERRAFFVERAGTFEVHTSENDLLFNSRRVGLTATGEPVRLLGGARLVGRVGAWDVGFFDAQTGRTPAGYRENLGVLRARRAVLNRNSWAGVMATTWATPDSSQVALAGDGELNVWGDDYLAFAAVALAGDAAAGANDGVFPRGALRLLAERRRNRGLWYKASLATTGSRYTPALGYVERSDAIRPAGEVGYGAVVSPAGHEFRAAVGSDYAWHNAGGTFDQSTNTLAFEFKQPNGNTWTLKGVRQKDDLAVAFQPTPATTVPVGDYTALYGEFKLTASTGPKAVVSGSARAGEYFDGMLYSLLLSPEWRASAHLRLSADFQVDRVEFNRRDQGEWSKLARLRVLASASPQLSLSATLQVNSLADLATGNFRLRYNVREGQDLWIVYGHDLNLDRHRLVPTIPETARSTLLVKYTHSFGT